MGGGAIKKNGVSICSRLPRAAYLAVKSHVLATLTPHVTACEAVLELPGKTDFGDLDVLYCQESTAGSKPKAAPAANHFTPQPAVVEILKQQFGVLDNTHMVRHGPVTSFAFNVKDFLKTVCPEVPTPATDYFQVDFIRAPNPASIAMCRFYFGYGDVGGILGRVFNYYGLKFGEAGLWCELFSCSVDKYQRQGNKLVLPKKTAEHFVPVAGGAEVVKTPTSGPLSPAFFAVEQPLESKKETVDPTATLGRIQLTGDPAEICKYAGLNYTRWCQGFDQVDDVIAWLVDCELFMPSIFDRLNYEHMCRANKRPFYQKFLDRINMTPGKAGATQVRSNRQLEAIAHFQQEDRLLDIIRGTEVAKERRAKFNGKMLSAVIQDTMTENQRRKVAADSDQEAAALDSAEETTPANVVKPLDGKVLGQAIFDFKVTVLSQHTAGASVSKDANKQEVEENFNSLLDELSADAVQVHMLQFAATYTPPAPAPPVEKKKKKGAVAAAPPTVASQ